MVDSRIIGELQVNVMFQLEITDQHWPGETHEQSHDGCSHGGIRATIAGTVVTSDDTEYGISQSALSLLRTLDTVGPDRASSPQLVALTGSSASV